MEIIRNLLKRADPDLTAKGDGGNTALHRAARNGEEEIVDTILNSKTDINAANTTRRTPLHEAVSHGHATIVNMLLRRGAEVNATDSYDQTPLFLAASLGYTLIAEILLHHGDTDVNKANVKRITPLSIAVHSGNKSMVDLLLKSSADVNIADDNGDTPLHKAVSQDADFVDMLLKFEPNVNLKNKFKETPLHLAVKLAKTLIVDMLLKRGSNVNVTDINYRTPMHLAAQRGLAPIVEMLIKFKTDLNKTDSYGNTPLLEAVFNGHVSIVPLLLDFGADVNIPNTKGFTALHNAVIYCTRTFDDVYIADLLVRRGADVNMKNSRGCAPLLLAASSGYVHLVDCLLRHNAEVNTTDLYNITPLQAAVTCSNAAVVVTLLESAADVNRPGMFGTLLHLAASLGDAPIVNLLLNAGSNINVKDDFGNTPLYLAVKFDKLSVIELLVQRGAEVKTINKERITPLHLAMTRMNIHIVEILLNFKAHVRVINVAGETCLHIAVPVSESSVEELISFSGADANTTSDDVITAVDYESIVKDLVSYNDIKTTSFQLESERTSATMVTCSWTSERNDDDGNLAINDVGCDEKSIKADINSVDTSTSNMSLILAVYRGETSVVEQLLQSGADVNYANEQGLTPLHLAILGGNTDLVSLLLRHGAEANKNKPHGNGAFTPLQMATSLGISPVIELLLTYNADVNVVANGLAPLHIAVTRNDTTIMDLLLKFGADVNIMSIRNTTPLHMAQNTEVSVSISDVLLSRGADANAKDVDKLTPLHMAVRNKKVPNVQLLLKYKADVNISDKSGDTPLHLAAAKGNMTIIHMLLNCGAELNVLNNIDLSPLGCALRSEVSVAETLLKFGTETNTSIHTHMSFQMAVFDGNIKYVMLLLKFGAEINATYINDNTPLHVAVRRRNARMVETLLSFGAKVNMLNVEGNTPLLLAVVTRQALIVDLLLRGGADVTTATADGNTPLHTAVCNGDTSIFDSLLRYNAEVKAKNNQGETPLHLAARLDMKSMARLLIKKGGGVNVTNNAGITPLHLALESGKVSIVKLLLDYGADTIITESYGNTMLHAAVLGKISPVVQMLLNNLKSNGNLAAIINVKNSMGNTPLHLAASNGNRSIVELLMIFGASVHIKNADGDSPLHLASCGSEEPVVDQLLSFDPAVDMTNITGDTPLHRAARCGKTHIVKSLLKKIGPAVLAANRYGDTALHMAARSGVVDTVEALLESSARVDATNIYGDTPLHVALRNCHTCIVELLLIYRADAKATNFVGNTTLHTSSYNNDSSTVELLLSWGADADTNKKNKSGDTPVHIAATRGYTSVVEKLLDYDKHANIANSNGNTPLHLAVLSGVISTVEVLLAHGINANITNTAGETPLYLAARRNDVAISNLLIDHNHDILTENVEGDTLLHEAARTGNEVILNLLLNERIDINIKNRYGSTPLHLAASSGEGITAAHLVRRGADINATDDEGNTPTHLAVLHGNINIVRLLWRRGADVTIKNLERNTPLTIARVFFNNNEIVSILKAAEKPTSIVPKKVESSEFFDNICQSTNEATMVAELENKTLSKFAKTTETSGIRGQWYETKLLCLVHIRALNDDEIEEFYLGTNMCDIGDLDDICLRYRVRGRARPVMLFVQAKHREHSDKGKLTLEDLRSATGDISLRKYFGSYRIIKDQFQSNNQDPMFQGDFSDVDCNFVIYTPAQDCLTYKKTDVKVSEKVHYLINTGLNTKYFQYDYDDIDIGLLSNMTVIEDLEKLGDKFIDCVMSGTENLDVLNNEIIASYHVYLRNSVLQVCKDKQTNAKYRMWKFRPEFFNSKNEYLVALKNAFVKKISTNAIDKSKITNDDKKYFLQVTQNPCALTISKIIGKSATYNEKTKKLQLVEVIRKKIKSNELKTLSQLLSQVNVDKEIIDEAVQIKLMLIDIKLPFAFGNMDMKFSAKNVQDRQDRMTYVAGKLMTLFKNNNNSMILYINDDDVGQGKPISPGFMRINGGIGSAVGNLLISDANNMLKFDLNNEQLPENAALFLKQLKDDRYKPDNEKLSSYRIKVDVVGFPKEYPVVNEDDKRQAEYFLSNLWFYVNQAREDEVEHIVYKLINKFYNNVSKINQIKFNIHPRPIYLKSYEEILNLWMETKKVRYLTKADDIFERAKLDCVYDILMTFIICAYYSNTHGINMKLNQYTRQASENINVKLDKLFEMFDTQNDTVSINDRKDILNLLCSIDIFIGKNVSSSCSSIFYNMLQDYEDHIHSISNKRSQHKTPSEMEYSKRAGTAGVQGQLYKTKLLHLVHLRISKDTKIETCHFGPAIQGIGGLDDICLRYKVQGRQRPVVVFLQVNRPRHDNSNFSVRNLHSASGTFKWQKCFESYIRIENSFKASDQDPMFDGAFADVDCYFFCHTSAKNFSSKKKPDSELNERVHYLLKTTEDTDCFQYDYDDDDVRFLGKLLVEENLKKLAKVFLEFIMFQENKSDTILRDELMVRYHVVLGRKMLQPCKEQEVNPKDRIWEFRQDFFTSDCDYLNILKKAFFKELSSNSCDQSEITTEDSEHCRQVLRNLDVSAISKIIGKLVKFNVKTKKLQFFSGKCATEEFKILQEQFDKVEIGERYICEAIQIKLSQIKIKCPLMFGNIDMTFSDGAVSVQKKITDMVSEIINFLENNNNTKIVHVSCNGNNVGEAFHVSKCIDVAVGNALVLDPDTGMLKFDLDNESLPANAALFLKELKSDKYKSVNEALSSYRFKVNMNAFPKVSFYEDEYDKKQARYFLDNFWFYTNQASDNKVELLLKKEINTYHDIKAGKKRIEYVHLSKNIISFAKDEILKWKVQPIGSSYLSRVCDFLERAELIDIDSVLLSGINFMYASKNSSVDIKFRQDLSEPERFKQMHRVFKKISSRLFKLFDSEFEDSFSIILPNPYLSFPLRCWTTGTNCKFGELLGFSLEVHPEMEWVALRLWAYSEDTKYVLVAKASPRPFTEYERPKDRFLLKQLYNGRQVYYINGKERQSPQFSLPSLGNV